MTIEEGRGLSSDREHTFFACGKAATAGNVRMRGPARSACPRTSGRVSSMEGTLMLGTITLTGRMPCGRSPATRVFSTAAPRDIVFFTDGIRQTAADLMQLVRVIEVGMDVDGTGSTTSIPLESSSSANRRELRDGLPGGGAERAGPGCSPWRATRWRIGN